MDQKYNYFYKTTNKINGNFYFGVHRTSKLNDGYLGSGTRIQYAIKKYGKENFENEILEFFDTFQEALDFESEIVTEELVLNQSCYNLTLGGGNCFNDWFVKQGYHIKGRLAANKILHKRIQEDPEFRKKFCSQIKKGLQKKYETGWRPWKGLHHSEKTKAKMCSTHKKNKHQQGEKNSQYGKCWIYNEQEKKTIRIIKEELSEWLKKGWKKGRKIKF